MTPDPFVFGYGSLVNRATHTYAPARRATLRGWQRGWITLPGRHVANLTAVRAPGKRIEGLIAPVPGGDWAALDLREAGYDRVAGADVAHDLSPAPAISVYEIPPQKAGRPAPILLSYLDVVVQGYLNEYGAEGVERFFVTTAGWHHPVADDRARPLYPRAHALSAAETALVDTALARIGVRSAPRPGPFARLRARLGR